VKFDGIVKSLILLSPWAVLGFITRLAKFQKLGLTPSNSLKFLTRLRRVNARLIPNLFPKLLNLVRKMTFYEFIKFRLTYLHFIFNNNHFQIKPAEDCEH